MPFLAPVVGAIGSGAATAGGALASGAGALGSALGTGAGALGGAALHGLEALGPELKSVLTSGTAKSLGKAALQDVASDNGSASNSQFAAINALLDNIGKKPSGDD